MMALERGCLHYRHGIWPAHRTRIPDILACKRSMGEKVITGLLDFPKSDNHDGSGKLLTPCVSRTYSSRQPANSSYLKPGRGGVCLWGRRGRKSTGARYDWGDLPKAGVPLSLYQTLDDCLPLSGPDAPRQFFLPLPCPARYRCPSYCKRV